MSLAVPASERFYPSADKRARLLCCLALALSLATMAAFTLGPSGFDGLGIFDLDHPLFALRLSRIALALLVGAALASSGCALQALFNNPLADPYVIGISGGSAVGGTLAIILFDQFHALSVPTASILGALAVSVVLSYALAKKPDAYFVLLAGVAINAFAGAFITLIKTLFGAQKTQTLLFWLIGNLGYLSVGKLAIIAIPILIGIFLLVKLSGALELLSQGADEACRLGVDVARTTRLIHLAISVMIGIVVAFCGMIGFVGLIVPQLLRLVIGCDQRILLPASTFLGALFLVVFDALGRAAFYYFHTEIPVGALTALFGAPVFGWLLFKKRNER